MSISQGRIEEMSEPNIKREKAYCKVHPLKGLHYPHPLTGAMIWVCEDKHCCIFCEKHWTCRARCEWTHSQEFRTCPSRCSQKEWILMRILMSDQEILNKVAQETKMKDDL